MQHPSAPAEGTSAIHSAFWARRTAFTQARVNFAWVLHASLPVSFIVTVGLMALILFLRSGQASSTLLYAASAAAMIIFAVGAFLRARGRFISRAQAQSLLEWSLRLDSRLSSAASGIGSWPASSAWKKPPWSWNAKRLLGVFGACSALLAAAFLLPIAPIRPPQPPPVAKPPALQDVESMLEELSTSQEIKQESLDQIREEAEQLAKQPPEQWYSHPSLEAADHLKEKLESGLKTLDENASQLESLLGASTADVASEAWKQQLENALSGLQGNVPGLNQALAERLAQAGGTQLQSLSKEQLEQLRQQLSDAKSAASRAGNKSKETGNSAEGEEGEEDSDSAGKSGSGQGRKRLSPSKGGIDRGPGEAPLTFSDDPAKLGSKAALPLENKDMSHVAVGDALGVSAGQHDLENQRPVSAAGGAAATGDGAGAIWMDRNLTPAERKRLQKFFK